MTLENLVRIGKLKALAADEREIARLLESAERALKDASVGALSADSRLELGYRALMQAALAAMLANGYRPATSEPGHHQVVIQALPKTIGIATERIQVLEAYRRREIKATTVACRYPRSSQANAWKMHAGYSRKCAPGSTLGVEGADRANNRKDAWSGRRPQALRFQLFPLFQLLKQQRFNLSDPLPIRLQHLRLLAEILRRVHLLH